MSHFTLSSRDITAIKKLPTKDIKTLRNDGKIQKDTIKSDDIKIPYYDKRLKYTLDCFNDSKIQKYIALFLSNPANYSDVVKCHINYRESFFMTKFSDFLFKYYIITPDKNFDMFIYFGSLVPDKKGSMDICGGSGKISGSARRQFIGEYTKTQENKAKYRAYLHEKYGLDFSSSTDPRIFIGHHNIWVNPSPELLKKEGWDKVITSSYDDETMEQPLPKELDIDLIPLSIRNKVYQKWNNRNNELFAIRQLKINSELKIKRDQEELEEELAHLSKSTTPSSNTSSNPKSFGFSPLTSPISNDSPPFKYQPNYSFPINNLNNNIDDEEW